MPAADRPRVLTAGGGVAALEAALAIEEIAEPPIELTLLAPNARFQYGPLSVAESFGFGRAHQFELADLLGDREVGIVADALESVDVERREVRTSAGRRLGYDALLIAVGARRRAALPGALTFAGPQSTDDVKRLLRDAASGRIDRLAVAVPAGVGWALPAYELALMASAHFDERKIDVEVSLVTPESRPLEAFGSRAGDSIEEMLGLRQIAFRSAVPLCVEDGGLVVEDGDPIAADAVIALPTLAGPELAGLPQDELGFVPTDRHGRVSGCPGVYAAGDATDFPVKQGGLAAQQADVAAEAIAADLGRGPAPEPFRPVLRGLLLTGRAPRYLRAEVLRDREARASAGKDPGRWPPAKIAGRRLGRLLAIQGAPGGAPPDAVAIELDVPLDYPPAGSDVSA